MPARNSPGGNTSTVLRQQGQDTARHLIGLGQHGDAASNLRAAVVHRTGLLFALEDGQDNAQPLHDLSVAYQDLGDVEAAVGNLNDAINAYERALIAAEALVGGLPNRSSLRKELNVVRGRLSDLRDQQ